MNLLILLVVMAGAFWILERFWPAAQLPRVQGWWARVALMNLVQLGIVVLSGYTWEKWFRRFSLLHISQYISPIAAGFVAYLVSCFVFYWWHRYRHESEFFWRVCHQLHHSPRRIEVVTSFYKHPVEITLNSIITSGITYPLLGCDTKAAAVYLFLTALAEYFYHWNIHTPRWVGWIIQRPESHRVHHQRNRHTNNYSDLPIFDWLFGTFNNPKNRVAKCGFDPLREARVAEMLTFRDVHKLSPAPICLGCSRRWRCRSAREGVQREVAA